MRLPLAVPLDVMASRSGGIDDRAEVAASAEHPPACVETTAIGLAADVEFGAMGGDVTLLLARWNRGDSAALEELMPLVYAELRQLADHFMFRERGNHTLQPTALVHEAYLRLAGVQSGHFNNRVHFYGAAAQAMRRILIDHARQRHAVRRGADPTILSLDDVPHAGIDLRFDLVALNDALDRLAIVAPRAAKVVELRYFGGMSIDEAAAFLQIAPVTVKRHWKTARAWLFRELSTAS